MNLLLPPKLHSSKRMSANRPKLDQREFASLIEAAGFHVVRRENLYFVT
jgi:hypothetical protein